jgi:hypothetical protein
MNWMNVGLDSKPGFGRGLAPPASARRFNSNSLAAKKARAEFSRHFFD